LDGRTENYHPGLESLDVGALIQWTKWLHPRRNLAVSDVFFMVIPSPKTSNWPIGRIVRVESGADGTVQSAEVEVTCVLPKKKQVKKYFGHLGENNPLHPFRAKNLFAGGG
jgi:hypothetical protein